MHATSLWLVALAAGVAAQGDPSGEYVGRTQEGPVALTLRAEPGGKVSGTLRENGVATPVIGRVAGGRLSATARSTAGPVSFTGTFEGDVLRLDVLGSVVSLTRARSAPPRAERGAAAARAAPAATPALRVVVNGVALDGPTLEALQRRHALRFASGDFWYDRVSGAWGLVGAPTAGVVAPGLPMGGPLRRDASRGDTGVVVNGRELRREEVLALQQLGPVYPGRYWIDARGNYGLEGGPPLGNLAAAAQAQRAPRQGILSTYDKTGVAVFGY